jgi:hypothetical protein
VEPGTIDLRREVPPLRVDDRRSDADRWFRSGRHRHDGFYFRLALGFAASRDHAVANPANDVTRDAGSVGGVGTATEVALGGSVSPRLILAGGYFGSTAVATSYERDDGAGLPVALRRNRSFSLVGPFIDWYFASRMGLHAQMGVGVATLSGMRWEQADFEDRRVAVGAGAMVGFGNEWWVSDNWGLGLTARLTAATLGEEYQGRAYFHAVATFPSLLFSATYN